MAIAEMFLWWYSKGWRVFLAKLKAVFLDIADFFSMKSLVRTLFKPYRQISAESASSSASIDIRFHMFLDRLISRIIGFFSRLILLLVGVILIIFNSIVSVILIILWPLIPLAPIAGIVLAVVGVII